MASKRRFACFLLLCAVLVVPAALQAQSDSSIAGVVTDETGGVLPGVTVEVASPALIERVRTAATDGQGRYLVSALRPGVYSVTFSLPGFSRVVREGIELTGSFTAGVNAQLSVGALEETITVAGESPVVDVQNVVRRQVVSHDVIDNLPTGKVSHQLAALMPGVRVAFESGTYQGTRTQDVGGSSGETLGDGVLVHNSRAVDNMTMIDGLRINGASMSGGGGHGMKGNPGTAQEIVVETSGISAEHELGGVRTNVIPKEGGNSFSGYLAADFGNHALYTENLSDELMARGITGVNKVDNVGNINPAFGGPIVRDRLWFHVGLNYRNASRAPADSFYDADPLDYVWTPDESRPARSDNWGTDNNIRLTAQASPRNKFNAYYALGYVCYCQTGLSPTRTYANSPRYTYTPNSLIQASWVSPVTNRFLLEAGVSRPLVDTHQSHQPDVPLDLVGVTELSTFTQFRGRSAPFTRKSRQWNTHTRFSASYVTGSHAFKAGFTTATGGRNVIYIFNADNLHYRTFRGVPSAIIQSVAPRHYTINMKMNLGLFVQDQWTFKRLTMNMGVRYDSLNSYYDEQEQGATRFTPAQTYPRRDNTPAWKDFSPRLGITYDLFGDGKTALKGHIGHYVVGVQTNIAQAVNPINSIVTSSQRTWADANGDFVPDCDLFSNAANGECGALADNGFGTARITRTFDPNYLEGWGVRESNWEGSIGIQQEVAPGLSVDAAYYRRAYANWTTTQNLLANGSHYDPYCVTAPQDSRLPGGGGNELCGFYDISPDKFGQVERFVTHAGNFGDQAEVYDGVDVTFNGRLPDGTLLGGGLSTGRVLRDNCEVVSELGVGAFGSQAGPTQFGCRSVPPWLAELKVHWVYGLPWDVSFSGNFQSIPGPQITASYTASNAQIAPSLGRDLAAGSRGRATVHLIEPGTMYEERFHQLDMRLAKRFSVGAVRVQGMFDVYNAFNSSAILGVNTRYGPAWLRPTSVLAGRLIKFGMQMDF